MADDADMRLRIESELDAARQLLTARVERPEEGLGPDGRLLGSRMQFEEFVSHGEYELAWDSLLSIGERESVPSDFWRHLAEAAHLMGDEAMRQRAEKQVQRRRTPEGDPHP